MPEMINKRVILLFRADVRQNAFGQKMRYWIDGIVCETDIAGIIFQPDKPLFVQAGDSRFMPEIKGKVFFPWSVIALIEIIDETAG